MDDIGKPHTCLLILGGVPPTPFSSLQLTWPYVPPPAASGNKVTVVQVAPAVRVAIAETMGLGPGEVSTGQLVAGLRKLGFNYVFGESSVLLYYGCFFTEEQPGRFWCRFVAPRACAAAGDSS
jgi:hypothetical protein